MPGRHNLGQRVVRVSTDVRNVHDPAFERDPPGGAVATRGNGALAQFRPKLGVRCSRLGRRHIAVDLALAYRDPCAVGAAKPGGRFDDCV